MAEQQILRLGCNGLTTDPGPFAGVPDGAMVEAQNVIFRRPGVAEPRPPLQFTRDASATGTCYGVFPFDDGSAVVPQWIGFSGWRSGGTTTVTGGFTFSQFQTRHSAYRGRGFFTSRQGIAVLDGTSDTSARLAGVPRGPGFLTTELNGTGAWLAANSISGYRTVVRRNGNGIPMRGSPSALREVCAESVSAYYKLRIYLTSDIVADDYIEVYRCTKVAGTVSAPSILGHVADESRLRASLRVTSSDIATGYIEYTDALDDAYFSGPYLYTNESQEGILLANERPNYCIDVDVYNRMHFFAGQRSPQRVTLTINGTGVPEAYQPPFVSTTDTTTRLLGAESLCNITNTSTTIALTVAGASSFLTVGQYVALGATADPEAGNAQLPGNTQIVSINTGANTIVVSNAATATAAGVNVTFFDFIEVDDGTTQRRIYTAESSSLSTSTTKIFYGTNGWTDSAIGTSSPGGASDIERAFAASYSTSSFRVSATPAGSAPNESIVLRIERTDANLGSFTVRSSKPLAFDQYVDSVTGNLKDALAWVQKPAAKGVTVVCAGQVHAGDALQKSHSHQRNPFTSQALGAHPAFLKVPSLSQVLACKAWPRVELVLNHAGVDGRLVRALMAHDAPQGWVVAGTGNGTLHHDLEAALLDAQKQGMQVLRASRCAWGGVQSRDADVLPHAGALTAVQARVALMLHLLAQQA